MITFHVGLHKTGTSAIQKVLRQTLPSSLNGAYYAGSGEGLIRDGGGFDERVVQLLKRRACSQHVILSNNGLIGNIGEVYHDAAEAASKIGAVFGDTHYQVILYVRPQLEWATSLYKERIESGYSDDPAEFIDGIIDQPNFKWTNLIRVIAEAIGDRNLIVRCYQSGLDAVDDFFHVLGLGEVPSSLKGTRDNLSLAPTQVAVLKNINEQAEPDLRPLIRYALQNNIEPRGPVQASPLPESAQEQLFEFFRNRLGEPSRCSVWHASRRPRSVPQGRVECPIQGTPIRRNRHPRFARRRRSTPHSDDAPCAQLKYPFTSSAHRP